MSEDRESQVKGESRLPESYVDIDPEIKAEFELAEKESRQPNCIGCGEPLEIRQTLYTYVWWEWDNEIRRYEKFQEDYSDCDKPFCLKCGYQDSGLTNNRWVEY